MTAAGVHHRAAQLRVATALAVLTVLIVAAALPASTQARTARPSTLTLADGGRLVVPAGALARGVKIRVSYDRAPKGRPNHRLGAAVRLRLVGGPRARRRLLKPVRLEYPASVGAASQIRTYDDRRRRWREVETTFDPNRNVLSARLRHFSWYSAVVNPARNVLAAAANHLNQFFGKWRGIRKDPPNCPKTDVRSAVNEFPTWVAGLDTAAGPNDPLPACGQSEGETLAVEFVNNRPYGIILNYNDRPVTWGWAKLGISLRDLRSVSRARDGLYVPKTSAGSIGVPHGPWSSATYSAGVSGLSLMGDLTGAVIESVSFADRDTASQTAARAMTYASAECLASLLDFEVPRDPQGVRDFILSHVDCAEAAVLAADRDRVFDPKKMGNVDNVRTVFKAIKWAGAAQLAQNYSELLRDATIGSMGAFTVRARPATPDRPNRPETPPVPPDPEPRPPQNNPAAQARAQINVYDNYGPASQGHAMCRGNPGRPESVPGGVAQQRFTVPAGVASLDSALVQIDPDSRVSATATLSVNGGVRATAVSSAAGDTRFSFPAVPVSAGDNVDLAIRFSASFGKIITVYSAAPTPGPLTVSNACSDGARSLTTGNGLRAVVSGWTR